jgi:hypothetical protein
MWQVDLVLAPALVTTSQQTSWAFRAGKKSKFATTEQKLHKKVP